MKSSVALLMVLLLFTQVACAAGSTGWLDRAPLNTDTDLAGLPWYGLGRAFRYLAYILNMAALAGLVYGLGRDDVDWSYFLYVYFGILLGSFLLSVLLNPILHVFSVLPVIALVAFLLARFCSLRPGRALTVALSYQIYQVAYMLVYGAIAGAYK